MSLKWRPQGCENYLRTKSSKRTDYNTYIFSGKEKLLYAAEGMAVVGVLGYFFYRSVLWTLFLSPSIVLFLQRKKRELFKARKERMTNEFKESLGSINDSLQSGYSLENAFAEAYRDMVQYYGAKSIIAKELLIIQRGIRNSEPLEKLLVDWGERSGVEDIQEFANILVMGKKSGGNLTGIIKSGIAVIEEKIETKQEIETVLSARRLESKVMSIIPFCMISYIELTSEGFFESLYDSIGGNIFMTLCLCAYLAALHISEKITDIEI